MLNFCFYFILSLACLIRPWRRLHRIKMRRFLQSQKKAQRREILLNVGLEVEATVKM